MRISWPSLVLCWVLVPWALSPVAWTREKADPRLREVKTVFVLGSNEAAEKVRSEIRKDTEKGKVCFSLATKASDADATLEVTNDSQMQQGLLKTRNDRVTGTLTLRSGDLIWSKTDNFSDAPLMSGVQTAAKLVYSRLKKDACQSRR